MSKNGQDTRPMVTRVAQAIWQANQPPGAPNWDDLTFQDQDQVETIAREAIDAMREPTEEMINSVYSFEPPLNCIKGHDVSDDEAKKIYQIMIDEALQED